MHRAGQERERGGGGRGEREREREREEGREEGSFCFGFLDLPQLRSYEVLPRKPCDFQNSHIPESITGPPCTLTQ